MTEITLKDFLIKNRDAVDFYFSIKDNYIPGRIYYRLTEMDFKGFVPKTFISEKVLHNKNFKSIKKIETRYNLNAQLKKIFKNEPDYAFLEHIVPSKYILENWKKYIKDIDAFEDYLRNEASICILMKSEEQNEFNGEKFPRTKGRETFEKSKAVYKNHGIIIKEFSLIR